MGGTPQAEIDDIAGVALRMKLRIVRAGIEDLRDKILPGIPQGSLPQVIDHVRKPERGT